MSALLLVLLMPLATLLAQLPTATILGTVKDTSGAVVPEATVVARNVETGQTRTGTTGADGSYRFVALPVGRYEVRAEHAGFRSEVRSGLTLAVTQEAVVNIVLAVGAVTETVTVTAEAPLVNTASGSLGGLVDEQKVADLPLNGRNYVNLSLLQPGVNDHRTKSDNIAVTGTTYSSNGAPIRSNNYLLDGAVMQNYGGTTAASQSGSTLGIDGIREYRVITNSFSAEYGMTMGSQMIIVSKGGTNNFHGSLLEYLRNDHLDARNFFDYKTPLTPKRLPSFKRNNFGASFGGPIRHDKTFFFGVYEALRERLGVTPEVATVLPPSAKVEPATLPDGTVVPQIASIVKPFLPLWPEPNLPNNQFTYAFTQPTREDFGQIRVDETLSDSDTAFIRYTINDSITVAPGMFPVGSTDEQHSRLQFVTLAENHIFSPSLLNTFRFSFSRTKAFGDSTSPVNLNGPQFSLVPGLPAGSISVAGYVAVGQPAPTGKVQNIYTWSDDLAYTRGGRHSFKFGALINRYQQFALNATSVNGAVTFANLTNFLRGLPRTYTAVTAGSRNTRFYLYTTLGFYAQDDLRLAPNLTLNLGLRYEFLTQPQEARGNSAALRDMVRDVDTTIGPPFLNPSLPNFSPRFGFAWDLRGDGKTALRGGFGLLYDVGTLGNALSAGAAATPPFSSRSNTTVPTGQALSLPLTFPPEAAGKALRPVDYHLQQPHLLQYNLTVERQLLSSMALTMAYAGSRGLNLMQQKEGNPTLPLGVPQGQTCVARPAGEALNLNAPTCWLANPPRLNLNWSTIELKTAASNSWYNSLQIGLLKRLSHGLQFQSSYTWSKTIDETQGQLGVDNAASSSFGSDPIHRKVDRAPAAFDIRQNWRFNAIYRLPNPTSQGGAVEKLLNGWWITGIVSVQPGYPFTPVLNNNRSRSGVNGGSAGIDRPDLVPGRSHGDITQGKTSNCLGVTAGQKLGGRELYFDPCAFAIPPAGFLGTAGRNILRGPGFANLDFSLAKDTPLGFLGESGKLEFRAEIFNLLNRANFDVPSRTVFAGQAAVEAPLTNAGTINSTTTTSRQIQLALKILF